LRVGHISIARRYTYGQSLLDAINAGRIDPKVLRKMLADHSAQTGPPAKLRAQR
jgi:hypothetical protein